MQDHSVNAQRDATKGDILKRLDSASPKRAKTIEAKRQINKIAICKRKYQRKKDYITIKVR
jgi:hypothetical protein